MSLKKERKKSLLLSILSMEFIQIYSQQSLLSYFLMRYTVEPRLCGHLRAGQKVPTLVKQTHRMSKVTIIYALVTLPGPEKSICRRPQTTALDRLCPPNLADLPTPMMST